MNRSEKKSTLSIVQTRLSQGAIQRALFTLVLTFVFSFSAFADVAKADAPQIMTPKIVTVDMQRALQSVESGKKAKSNLEKEFNSKKKELQQEETSIKKMADELKKQSLVMNDEARAKKQGELQDRYLKLQEQTARSQMELQQKERELTQPIIEELKELVAEMGQDKAVTILEKSAVLYAPDKDDLTDEVITSFNKRNKSAQKTAKKS